LYVSLRQREKENISMSYLFGLVLVLTFTGFPDRLQSCGKFGAPAKV
jgi:hypothetical protein